MPNAELFYEAQEQMNFNASLTLIANVGELAGKLSEDLKKLYPKTEWQKIKDLRNRIVHDYAGIDIYLIFNIIQKELPPLKETLEKILVEQLNQNSFDLEEYKIAQKSHFYKYIDFENFRTYLKIN